MGVIEKVKLLVLGGPMDGLAYDVKEGETTQRVKLP
jgi:hypothetical protein